MDKRSLIRLIMNCSDEFYMKPYWRMKKIEFKKSSYQQTAVNALCDFISDYPIADVISPFEAIQVINEFDNMLTEGAYRSKNKDTQIMFSTGRKVVKDMVDVLMGML